MNQPADSGTVQARIVPCPSCAGPSVYAPSNAYRPFCSERCKQMDLGAWASEQFSVAASTEPDEQDQDER